MPLAPGSTRPIMALAAMAASIALPPAFRMSRPVWAASGWLVATMPYLPVTTERLWCGLGPGRSYSPIMRRLLVSPGLLSSTAAVSDSASHLAGDPEIGFTERRVERMATRTTCRGWCIGEVLPLALLGLKQAG